MTEPSPKTGRLSVNLPIWLQSMRIVGKFSCRNVLVYRKDNIIIVFLLHVTSFETRPMIESPMIKGRPEQHSVCRLNHMFLETCTRSSKMGSPEPNIKKNWTLKSA